MSAADTLFTSWSPGRKPIPPVVLETLDDVEGTPRTASARRVAARCLSMVLATSESRITDELLEYAWDNAETDARNNGAVTIREMGYRGDLRDHPDWGAYVLNTLEDTNSAVGYIQEHFSTTHSRPKNRYWDSRTQTYLNGDMETVTENSYLSPEEHYKVQRWWSKKFADTIAEYTDNSSGKAKYVYIDHYPAIPEKVERRDIGHGPYADYIIVPHNDNANPSTDRLSGDVAMRVDALSPSDFARLTKPEKPKRKRR